MNLSRVSDLRKIYFLKAVIEEGSFRSAARKLGVTPSAVSQSISSLEAVIQKNLIIREKNSIRFTPEATEILEKIAPALIAIDDVFDTKPEALKIARLDLGAYESIAVKILPHLLNHLREDHGKFKFNVVIARTHSLLQKLRTGELCTTIIVDSEDVEGIKKEVLTTDEMGLFISSDSPYKDNPYEAAETLGVGCINSGHNGHPRYLRKFIDSFGKEFRPNVLSDSFEVLKQTTKKGGLISYIPKKIARDENENLLEVTDLIKREKPENGHHEIVLGYLEKCSDEEAKYIASLVQKYFLEEA